MNKGLSEDKIKKIMRYFCEDIAASKTGILLGINRNTINRYFKLFQEKIAAFLRRQAVLILFWRKEN